MVKCPDCSSELRIFWSICMDFECCGMAHEIDCSNCRFSLEFWDDDTLNDKWAELGGYPKDVS